MLKIVEKSKIWFGISITIIVIGLASLAFRGLNLGIDFTSGTVLNINIGKDFQVEDVRQIVAKYDNSAKVQKVEDIDVEITSNTLTDAQNKDVFSQIKAKYNLKDEALLSSDRIGPTVGQETTRNAIIATALACIGILLYVSLRFEFKSGVSAIASLVHDLLIMVAVYSILQIPVNASFIAAILTVLGYSINDTIVVFDRIRENRKNEKFKDYVSLVNGSITQTMARSINTVMTVLITISCVNIFGVPAVREFALPLLVGIVSGCYSSIFIASPIWCLWKVSEKRA